MKIILVYHVILFFIKQDDDDEVCFGFRDGSAHILRYLKVWFDLPTDVLCVSINIMDRFLSKMKVPT
jgi:hypothetical protein